VKPLAIIPAYSRRAMDVDVLETCLWTLRETAGDGCDVLVVDDGSPEPDLVRATALACERHDAELVERSSNAGFSATVNVGLRRCLEEGRDAVLANADIEFGLTKDWLGLMERQQSDNGSGLASIVGALLLYPPGLLIAHGGIYFSLLARYFAHRFQYAPADLPEAQIATVCPVTAALMFIRHECLEGIGLFDESFGLAHEDVDYDVRAWQSGRQCVYQPGIRAIHRESFFRGQVDEKIANRTEDSWRRFREKHSGVSFAQWVPDVWS
jgi:GT2 family glycosyltransferase